MPFLLNDVMPIDLSLDAGMVEFDLQGSVWFIVCAIVFDP